MACFSKETQGVFISTTLNCCINPAAIQKLYRTVGVNWFNVLVTPRVYQYFKDATVKYASIDIAPNREAIRHEVASRLNTELSQYSIGIPDLLLDDIQFLEGFQKSIEDKQIATQNALKEEQNVKVKEWQAQQAAAEAQGQADAIRIVAEGQSDANKLLNASLSENVIRYTMIQKLAPNVNVMMVPSGNQFIFDAKGLGK
jgi:regulator of protease activity HflC (stomatin/prohibitin superfamily)